MNKWINNKTYVKIHSGYNEIGGNIIEVGHKDTKIVFDLGLSFTRYKKFYEWPLRTPRGIDELIELNVVPKVPGLFNQNEEDINAIFITHAHRDHSELIQYLQKDIPIYMGETSKIIINTRKEVYGNKYEIDIDTVIRPLRTGYRVDIGNIEVEAIHVDHSIPGAYAYIIQTPDTTLLYTGDYRLHGGKICEKSLTLDLIERAKQYDNIDLFITEGTRFIDSTPDREIDVLNKLNQIMSQFNGLILLEYSYLDIDRYESILEASMNWNREIIFDYRHFIFLYNLYKKDPGLHDKIGFDRNRDLIHVYVKNIKRLRKNVKETLSEIDKEGFNVINELDNIIDKNVILEGFDLHLQDIYKKRPEYCIAIHSTSEPYDEEIEISYEKIINWLKMLGAPSYRIHSSGHIHPIDLMKVYREIKPKDVLVIHSEHPDQIKRLLQKNK